jgi:hypothetical protein
LQSQFPLHFDILPPDKIRTSAAFFKGIVPSPLRAGNTGKEIGMSRTSAQVRVYWRTIALLLTAAGVLATEASAVAQSGPSFRIAQTPQAPQASETVPPGVPSPPPEAAELSTPPAPIPTSASAFEGFQGLFSSPIGGVSPTTVVGASNSIYGSTGAYIDSAIPRTLFRTRYDASGGYNHPDRAEFFWPQFGPTFSGHFSSQQIDNYLEYAPTSHFSAFIDAPVRFLHLPQANHQAALNFGGLSDLTFGTKYAFVARPEAFYTFQLELTAPTGDARRGLGTGHPTLQPCLLAFRQLSERFFVVGQFCDWIPVGGPNFSPPGMPFTPNFAGNVLSYGVGGIYNAVRTERFRFAPTLEFVGWTALSGRTGIGTENQSESAAGQTIVNAKLGARFAIGDYFKSGGSTPLNDRVSLYAGYGRSLTGDVWYKNIFRLELTIFF